MSAQPRDKQPDESGPEVRRWRLRRGPVWVIATAVAILLLVSQLAVTGKFFSVASLSTLTPLIGIMIIVATGQAFVIGTGGIDLSVPAVITLMGSIILKQSAQQNGRLVGALALCAIACVVIGLVNGMLIEGLRLPALVVTLAVGQIVSGVTRIYQGGALVFTNVPPTLSRIAGAEIGGVSYLVPIAIGVALLMSVFLRRILPGRRLVASSAAPRSAFLAAIRANNYRILAYVLAALAYGSGGVLAAGQIGTPDLTLGDPYLLASVVAVVLGGAVLTGGRVSPVGTLLGAVFIVVLGFDLQVKGYSAGVQEVAQGVVLALALSLPFAVQNLSRLRPALRRARPSVHDGTKAVVN